mmetsp:Transcript_4518/g.14499  ORF Transcript_4518/g.14499 Transcript_4518/m.14499 type:complete len:180 (+) Transcript_4518:68-607(+)
MANRNIFALLAPVLGVRCWPAFSLAEEPEGVAGPVLSLDDSVLLLQTGLASKTPVQQSGPPAPAMWHSVEPGVRVSCLENKDKVQLETVTLPGMAADGFWRWGNATVLPGDCASAGFHYWPWSPVFGSTEVFKDRIGHLGHMLTEIQIHPERYRNFEVPIQMELAKLPEIQTIIHPGLV